jgi:hypothetical protein
LIRSGFPDTLHLSRFALVFGGKKRFTAVAGQFFPLPRMPRGMMKAGAGIN